jgi:hypothetical protein
MHEQDEVERHLQRIVHTHFGSSGVMRNCTNVKHLEKLREAKRQSMRTQLTAACVGMLAFFVSSAASPPEKPTAPDHDEQVLQQAKVAGDAKSIQQYLVDRCGKDADLLKANELVRELGAEKIADREKASQRLAAYVPHNSRCP